ncbi:hypothetical protein [Bifidobacterium jacchi]|uniref:tRNA nuclease CdiA C-terminal domain-containing protein n=1 Tax=Bifidobacterium jacchi TaxID=2490545 RepID=A0A5N5RM40_9BIFI|nr:hypothetical protein [Bifidobacterium jacchi]KAB5608405.1 hypothetical protein EHS19_01925 [Bifidobacterium jacchi]
MTDSSRTPDRKDVDKLARAQQEAVRAARRELRRTFETVYNMYYGDPAGMRDALLDLVPAIARKYGDVGSVAAGEWFEQMRAKWFKDQTDIDATYQPDDTAMRGTIRRLAGHLWDEEDGTPADPDMMLRGLLANMDKWVKAGGRETIERASRRDARKPRYARVPQGPTCGFCIMLASRGFVYSSAEAAGGDMNDYHNDCDCEPIPSWDKKNPKIEGYDPDSLYERYSACRSTVENLLTEERYRKTYRDVFVPRYEGDEPKTFNQWVARQIAAEMDTRDRQWLYAGTPCPIDKETGAKPLSKEWNVGKGLTDQGFNVKFIKEINKNHIKTPDAYLNDVAWEFKIPDSWNSEKTIKNQFKKAEGKGTSKLLISNESNKAPAEAMKESIQLMMESQDFPYIDEVLFWDSKTGELTRFKRE